MHFYPSSVALACSDDSPTSTPMPDPVETKSPLDTLAENFKVEGSDTSESKVAGRPFFVAFVTVFLAELGDKTQLATLLISAESQSPWVVFIGATAALIMTSLLGVLLGQWLASRLSPSILKTLTGAGLLLISVLLLWDVVYL